MSTVLRPAGPEPAQTYWLRRLVVVAAAIVVLAVVVALIANGTSSGSAVQGGSPSPVAAPTGAAATSTRIPDATERPGAGQTPSGAAASTPAATRSSTADPSTTSSSTTDPSTTPAATPQATPGATPTPTAKPKPKPTAKPRPAACDPGALRPTLNGAQRLAPKQRSTFTLSLINGSGRTCSVTVNRDNFELVITSGSDRIWSTEDCVRAVRPLTKTLAAEQALEWKLDWDGLRSRSGCRSRPEVPRPGTYYATAQLDGAEPVRLLITLRGQG